MHPGGMKMRAKGVLSDLNVLIAGKQTVRSGVPTTPSQRTAKPLNPRARSLCLRAFQSASLSVNEITHYLTMF